LFFPGTKDYFFKRGNDKKGYYLTKRCVACYNKTRVVSNLTEENRVKRNKSSKKWRDKNPGKVKVYAEKSRAKNPERLKEQNRAAAAKFRKLNPEKARRFIKNSLAKHPNTIKICRARRKARKNELPFLWNDKVENFARTYWKGLCAYCGNPPGLWHIIAMDHFIPITHEGCLGTVPKNMIPACNVKKGSPADIVACNQSKRNLKAETWLVKRFGLRKAKAKLKEIAAFFEAAHLFAESHKKAS